MLVCHLVMRPPGRVLETDVAEAATADDGSTAGNVIFAALVDDPAAVGDLVDAFFGEILVEEASASDAVSAGSVFGAAVDETVTATATADGTTGAISTRSAMIAAPSPVFINPGASREAQISGAMINQ